MGSLKTESRVLVVVRVVREAREGGMVSDIVYVVTMSPRVGMTSLSVVMLGTTSRSFSSCDSDEEVGTSVERIGRMVLAVVRGEGREDRKWSVNIGLIKARVTIHEQLAFT